MRTLRSAVLVVTALLLPPALSSAQSLGEVAAREKQKKKQQGSKPVRVITEEDLRRGGRGNVANPDALTATPSPDAAASPAPKEGAAKEGAPKQKEKTEEELQAERQAAWRERTEQAKAEVARISGEIDRLQFQLNDMTGNLYGAQRTSMLNQMQELQKQLPAAQQKVADLEEEGRRNRFR